MKPLSLPLRIRILIAAVALLGGVSCANFSASPTTEASATWVGSWSSAQLLAEGDKVLPMEFKRDVTLRQIVRLSIGGSTLRLRISNVFGTEPLHVRALHVARPFLLPSSQIDPASDRAVTFNERANAVIPAGGELTSDPVTFAAEPLSSLAVTMQIETVPVQQTTHVASHTTSYLATKVPASASKLSDAESVDHWYFLSGIDVLTREGSAIVAFGDSITDGSGSTKNGNDRWTDILAERLQRSAAHRSFAVLNVGIGGNRLLLDGNGPNAVARFDRDVLARSGVRYLIVLEGINDLGMLTRDAAVPDNQHEDLVRRMINAYREIVTRARTHGIKVIGGTLLPFAGFEYYHPGALNERDRQQINAWIRTPGNFDAVVDLDKVMADPERPDRLKSEYDSGDHIHPSAAGYRAMGEAIAFKLFTR